MKWVPHYTGSESYSKERSFGPFRTQFYMSRDRESKRLGLIRYSFICMRGFGRLFGTHIGLFPHRPNYGGGLSGWEFFTEDLHFGWNQQDGKWKIVWHGSAVDPYHTYVLHFGHLFLGSRAEKWLQRIPRYFDQRRWAKAEALYEQCYQRFEEDE